MDLTDTTNLMLEPMFLDPGAGFLIAMIGIAGGKTLPRKGHSGGGMGGWSEPPHVIAPQIMA